MPKPFAYAFFVRFVLDALVFIVCAARTKPVSVDNYTRQNFNCTIYLRAFSQQSSSIPKARLGFAIL